MANKLTLADVEREARELMRLAAEQPPEPPIVRKVLGGWVSRRRRSAEIEAMDSTNAHQ